jgi:hypothetical protein
MLKEWFVAHWSGFSLHPVIKRAKNVRRKDEPRMVFDNFIYLLKAGWRDSLFMYVICVRHLDNLAAQITEHI